MHGNKVGAHIGGRLIRKYDKVIRERVVGGFEPREACRLAFAYRLSARDHPVWPGHLGVFQEQFVE